MVIGITLGDVGGIGPEVALKAAFGQAWGKSARLALIGSRSVIAEQARRLRLPMPPPWSPGAPPQSPVVLWEPGGRLERDTHGFRSFSLKVKPGRTGVLNGRACAEWIRAAALGCRVGWFDAMVTGPISKESLQKAGVPFPGHTEYLAHLAGRKRFAMLLIGGPLRVALVTRHVPLSRVPALITRPRIELAVRMTAAALRWLGVENRRIAVAALNPHAGEGGMLGREERTIIAPALNYLRGEGVPVEGPVPADVLFHQAVKGRFGAVVALYHDQGLAPLKLLAFETGVNLTLGLPFVRTSPDHGTAFDIAGLGRANPSSMIEAVKLAIRLAHRPNPWKARAE